MSELIAGLVLVSMLAYVSEATERITVNFDANGPH
jgi:Flp pilus assembly pilin Flp